LGGALELEAPGAGLLLFAGQELGVMGFQGDEPGELGVKRNCGGGGGGNGRPAGLALAKGCLQGLAERGFARLEVEEFGPGGGLNGLGLGAGHLEPLLQKAGGVLRRGHGSGGQWEMQNAECRMQNGTRVSGGHRPPLQGDFAFLATFYVVNNLHFALA
jgi:hypothetical protein